MKLDLSMVPTQKISWIQNIKAVTPPFMWQLAYKTFVVRDIHDGTQYRPHYLPWLAPEFQDRYKQISAHTLVAIDRCWYLSALARQALMIEGSFLEAGTYKGGTARKLSSGLIPVGCEE